MWVICSCYHLYHIHCDIYGKAMYTCMCGGGEPCMHERVEEVEEKEVPMGGGRAETKND